MKKTIQFIIMIALSFILYSCPDAFIGLGDKVDLDPPSLKIGEYGDGSSIVNGDYVRGTIILNGTISDDTGIKSVQVSLDEGISFLSASVSGNANSWSFTIDTSLYEDGERELIVRVTDTAPTPRIDEERILLYFDNTPPVVIVKNPSGYEFTDFSDALISIKGEASDPFRIKQVFVDLVGGSGSISSLEGTNSWSCTFVSPGTGSYIFKISAEDYAGNVSTHFYHYDDILDMNGNNFVTAEDIYRVENGQNTVNLTQSELSSIEMDDITFSISMDLDNPVISISNPDPTALVFENIMSGTPKFIGSVSDDDGVDLSTLEISFDGGSWESVSGPKGAINGSGRFISWSYNKVYDTSGDHTLQIRVSDIYGVSETSSIVNYRINMDAALVEINNPASGSYIDSSDFSIEGTAEVVVGGITNIDISLDNGVVWNSVYTSSGAPSSNISWSYEASGVSNGLVPVKVRASNDNGGTWSYTNTQITVDTSPPVSSYTSPKNGSYVNGELTLRGTSTDNNILNSVEIKVGDDSGEPWVSIPSDELYSWTYTINSADYENSTAGTETAPSSGIFKVNFYIRATDKAGNVTESAPGDYSLYIDNALDKPIISIIAPQQDVSLGGSTIVSGTSSDDDGEVYGVYMQIDGNTPSGGTPNFTDTVDLGPYGIDFDGSEGNPAVTMLDESQAYLVDGKAPWSVTLNEYGEFYSTETGHSGDIHIRVFAKDKDGGAESVSSDVKTLHFRFDNSIPQISNLDPASKSYVQGIFSLGATINDETKIKHLEISYNGGTTYHYVIKNGVEQPEYDTGAGTVTKDYTANISIDTSNIPDVGSVISDDIAIRLKVTDDTNYQSQETLIYYVDNTLPSGWIDQDTSDINGTESLLYGYADDTGVVSGVEKIVLYFEKNGLFYNPLNGSTTAVTTEEINGSEESFPTESSFQMVIDSTAETLSGSNSDGDGLAEELNVGTNYEWKVQIDSTQIPDGIGTLHYVVYDKAGNRYHGSKSLFIKNDKPQISSIDVGFDLDSSGTVLGDEIFSYAGQFKARSRLYFNFNASDSGGISSYKVYKGTNISGIEVLSAVSGEIDISSEAEGFYSYFCQVTDTDGITVEDIILVEIDNIDNDPPLITLNPLTKASVVDGHIEVENDSLYNGSDADVSGTINLTGKVSDDQGIKEFRLELDGKTQVLALWSGGFFESQNSNFSILTQSINPGTGHEITWSYDWNTADISNVADQNITVLFTADDFASVPNQDSNSLTVDVVPYISTVETSISSSFSNAFSRSAKGKYGVWVNSNDNSYETVTVRGYNLNPTLTGDSFGDVRLSQFTNALNGAVKSGEALIYGSVGSDKKSLEVSMAADGGGALQGSGYLTIFTNNIPSTNNTNNNSTNSEADYINANLSDDRYFSLWDLRLLRNDFTLADHAVYPSMSMNGDTPEFGYENNSQGWGIALYHDGTTERKVYENWDLFTYTAIDHNSSGDEVMLFDINVVNGNYGDYNSGNYGGILSKVFGNVPTTSWNYWSYRFNDNQMWLENLVDENGITTAVLDRYRYPDIMTVGSSTETQVFYSVYDRLRDQIVFRHYLVGTDSSIDNSSGGQINDSGTAYYTNLEQHESQGSGSFPEYDGNDLRFTNSSHAGKTPRGQQIIETVNTGEFTAVAGTSDGSTAVIAYYDASGTGNIRLKYNNSPDNSGTWTSINGNDLIDSGHGGEYLDMKIDSDDNIHIGYYDNNNGDLRYLYIPVNDFLTGSFGAIQSVIVDSYFDVGDKVTLELDSSDGPFLAYKGVNRSGKVAWLTGALGHGSDTNNMYTGTWEIAILPTQINNTDSNRYCIGLDTSDLPVVGYTNGGLEYIRMLTELTD